MGGRREAMRFTMIRAVVWAGALSALGAPCARAQQIEYGGQGYQQHLVDAAREAQGLEYDPAPEGKMIERIVQTRYDVITPDEPYPLFLNLFHVTTLAPVVRRELLFSEGERWNTDHVLESAHNLRSYLFLSFAQIVACKGSAPDRVIAVVVTKDLWSLRPNFNFSFGDGKFEQGQAELTEENVAGRMKRATIDLGFDLARWYAGLQYLDPRIWGGELSMLERGDLFVNRASGQLEGGVATLILQKPQYTLDTRWFWGASLRYRQEVARQFTGGGIADFVSGATGESMPYQYNQHLVDLQAGATRSFGYRQKDDFSAGYRGFVHLFDVPALTPPVSPATQADFEASVLPHSESAGMLYVGYHRYEGEYHGLIDIDSFAVNEEYRFGLDLSVELRLANPAFGFSSSFYEPVITASWTRYEDDDLFVVSAGVDTRYQPELGGSMPWVDGTFMANVRNVSPRFGFLRLHTDVRGIRRVNDFNHFVSVLGGDVNPLVPTPIGGGTTQLATLAGVASLRGYPSGQFIGENLWAANAELRTVPVALWSVHLGLAAFYDMGAASTDLTALSPFESVGAGVRIGLPQFNTDVLRLDFGYPLRQLPGIESNYLVAVYGQAF
jgi:hypothetical protein